MRIREVEKKIFCTSNPVLGTRLYGYSSSTVEMQQEWDGSNATFIRSIFNTLDSRTIKFISSPSTGTSTFTASGDVEHDRQIDNTNKLYITSAVNVVSGAKITRTQDPDNSVESVDVDGDMQADEEFVEANGEVVHRVRNKATGADIVVVQNRTFFHSNLNC